MTLYLRGKIWYYDFWYQGKRYRKAVCMDRGLAEKAETVAKSKAMQSHLDVIFQFLSGASIPCEYP